jgi:hypothetical protein
MQSDQTSIHQKAPESGGFLSGYRRRFDAFLFEDFLVFFVAFLFFAILV